LDPFAEIPNFSVKYKVEDYSAKSVMQHFMDDTLIVGKMDLSLDIALELRENQDALAGLNGRVILAGRDMTLYGIELDKLIRKFERSQNFNLVDLGAVMFMGPAGLAVSKGGSYADIIASDYSENSAVTRLVSELEFVNGKINFKDLAFSTLENRVVAKGWVDIPRDTLDATFAVVDKNGCSIIEQQLYGNLENPERSRVKFLETIIAPVTNLLQAAVGNNCEPFYTGSVPHPESK
jgi:AsmA protein